MKMKNFLIFHSLPYTHNQSIKATTKQQKKINRQGFKQKTKQTKTIDK